MAANIRPNDWLPPWEAIEQSGSGLSAELAREVCSGHCLFGVTAIPVAWNSAPHRYDDFLFKVDLPDYKYALVHLTWKPETRPEFPFTSLFRDWEHFCTDSMIPDHNEHNQNG